MQIQESNTALVREYLTWKNANPTYRSVLTNYSKELEKKSIINADELDVTKFIDKHCKKAGTWNSWLAILRSFYA